LVSNRLKRVLNRQVSQRALDPYQNHCKWTPPQKLEHFENGNISMEMEIYLAPIISVSISTISISKTISVSYGLSKKMILV